MTTRPPEAHMSGHARVRSQDGDALHPSSRTTKDAPRTPTAVSPLPGRTAPGSFAPSFAPPGSFSTEMKHTATVKPETPRPDYFHTFPSYRGERIEDDKTLSEQRQAGYREQLDKEFKIKIGSENLLEALHFKKHAKEQRSRVESELDQTNRKIAQLKFDLAAEVERSNAAALAPSAAGRLSQLFQSAGNRSPSRIDVAPDPDEDETAETESPTYVLVETLQSLEAEGLPVDYYVEHANNLTELFKRHTTLKYDLVWSIFGLRVQGMLLSDSREVAAAGFRMMRYAITDRKSLSIMRSFQTDILVTLALIKEGKNSVEREQALKFIRAFLDVKDGVEEIPRSIVRVLVAVAEHHDDKLRNMCLLTLSELLIRKPALVAAASGMGALADALGEGLYLPSESLTCAFLFLLETPARRKFLRSGHELDGPFGVFADDSSHMSEERMKTNARVIARLLKSWTGLIGLSVHGFLAVRTFTSSLYINSSRTRDLILEVLLDVLRIKPPSWTTSFLAGRRLTTYGRVPIPKADIASATTKSDQDDREDGELVKHFTALVLTVLLRCGLLKSLVFTLQNETEPSVRRKATLLMGEALDLANDILPGYWTPDIQILPELFLGAANIGSEKRFIASSLIYQIDSVNRTLYRTSQKVRYEALDADSKAAVASLRRPSDLTKDTLTPQIEEGPFRAVCLETQVPITPNYTKWRWDLIEKIIEGPLLNPKRLEEVIKVGKFIKRLVGFYRPFKYRFCEIRNTKPNQRYVRIGCSLMKTLLQTSEGVRYLAENKLLRQLAECLAQVDRLSGLTSSSPHFAPDRIADTLSGGYFALLGAISSSPKGIAIIERWKMMNMFYHIVELRDRDDLIRCLLGSMDYSIDSHLRVILSKALTSCPKDIRVFSTRLLRKYATGKGAQKSTATSSLSSSSIGAQWAVDMLVTQLYDPDVEVCEVAIKILEEVCNETKALEYVVQCRPALDHLGEIGAPLLLRFLSTSVGYHYLDELDYISQEMDDWFLGRNDSYVMVVEASVARALAATHDTSRGPGEEAAEEQISGVAPPHFYRELTRTAEGCKLLERKGHFDEFVYMIRHWGMESVDKEMIVKVKGCMWAVGNVGSMELGAPFLEACDVVELIVKIAEESEIMSMRGTAFFALGLISRSVHGQELLAECGWDISTDTNGRSLGISLPKDSGKLFSVKPWTATSAATSMAEESEEARKLVTTDEDPVNARILELINDLSNTVLAKNRAAELHSLKAKKAPGFRQPAFFHKVMALVDRHHVRLPVLRFVIDLFDRKVLREIVTEEEEDDDEGDTTLRMVEQESSPARGG